MKLISYYILLLGLLSCFLTSSQEKLNPVEEHGKLNFEGNLLKDKNGKVVQLKGMSLFWSQWQPQFYTQETVRKLKESWGVNVVRVAMGIENGGYLENPEIEKRKIYKVLDAAIKNGIYVIVDWHDHHAEDHLQEAQKFFSEVSAKYGSYPNIIYETYNEPLKVSWKEILKPYHTKIIAAIRKNDPDNLIICGTPQWSQKVGEASLDPLEDFNVGYTLHFYAGTHGESLRKEAEAAIKRRLPIFVTEFGTTLANGDGRVFKHKTEVWLKFMDKHHLSWCNWSIANKDEASAALKPHTSPATIDNKENLSPSGLFIFSALIN